MCGRVGHHTFFFSFVGLMTWKHSAAVNGSYLNDVGGVNVSAVHMYIHMSPGSTVTAFTLHASIVKHF